MSFGSGYSGTNFYDVGYKKYSNCLLLRLKMIVVIDFCSLKCPHALSLALICPVRSPAVSCLGLRMCFVISVQSVLH